MPEMPPLILELERHLQRYVSRTQARFSRRKVPHLIVWAYGEVYSVCFFNSTKTWRVFYPWPSYGKTQTKIDIPSFGHVVEYFQLGASSRINVKAHHI